MVSVIRCEPPSVQNPPVICTVAREAAKSVKAVWEGAPKEMLVELMQPPGLAQPGTGKLPAPLFQTCKH